MPDIIDNRTSKLAERIDHYLRLSRQAHFAVGYFYLGGFAAIAEAVDGVEKLRLLIGPSTDRPTVEQIARGWHDPRRIQQRMDGLRSPRPMDRRQMCEQTLEDARHTLAHSDQSDEAQQTISALSELIASGKIEVRVYTKEPLHAKCYIFDEADPVRASADPGHVIIGSSNLTLSGITSNTELNVVLQDRSVHERVTAWFEQLWDDAEEFSEALMHEVNRSWARNEQITPWDVYLKTLHTLFRDQLETEEENIEVIDERWPQLAEYQSKAYNWARERLTRYGGVLIADVVGLGKSYVGLALLKWGRLHGKRPLIVCPAKLAPMWQAYSEYYDLAAPVVSMGMLSEATIQDEEYHSILDESYSDYDLVLIDESHNFRYPNTRRYGALEAYLSRDRREVIMLTATPMATSPEDLRHQLQLWPDSGHTLPTGQWSFDEFFRRVKKDQADVTELLRHVMIRRRRADVADKWLQRDGTLCPDDARPRWKHANCRPIIMVGNSEYTFPQRELRPPVEYRIDQAYRGLYATIRTLIDPQYDEDGCLPAASIIARVNSARHAASEPLLNAGQQQALTDAISRKLTYARYGLHQYVCPSLREQEPYRNLISAGTNLRGLMRVLLFKRLESSVEAFRTTCKKLAESHRIFVTAMQQGLMPAGEEMQKAIYELDDDEASVANIMDAIEQAGNKTARRYDISAFDVEALQADLQADEQLFSAMYHLVSEISPADDAKLQRLKTLLHDEIESEQKVIIFTQFEDTAHYLHTNLGADNPQIEWVSAGREALSIVARFAPRSNPGLASLARGREPIRVLISTDVLSEGQNLQDAHCVINYDLHFNPVRLIQRFGRIDRLMPYFADDEKRSPAKVWAWNFFPETALDTHLELTEKISRRVDDIHRIIGHDAPVLTTSETVDEEGIIGLYSGDGAFAYAPDDDLRSPLADAEQLIRDIQRNRPDEYERISALPDGVRTSRAAGHDERGFFVYCRAGDFHQLYLADREGHILSSDLGESLRAIECAEDEPRAALPADINHAVMAVKSHFESVVADMQARRRTLPRQSDGQRYALSHLREQRMTADEDDKEQLYDRLIEAFSRPISRAVRRRLNFLRKEKLEGEALLGALRKLYVAHGLQRKAIAATAEPDEPIPQIICSEALRSQNPE